MRHLPNAGLLLAAMLCAGTAQAQFTSTPRTTPPSRPDWRVVDSRSPRVSPPREQQDIRERIEDGRSSRQLSRREARQLRRENRQLGALADRYGSDGLSDAEARELENRALVLRAQVGAARSGTGRTPKR